jgi:hypothetical protein
LSTFVLVCSKRYQTMEFENELPSFEGFFKKAHYNSDSVFAGYQSKQDFLKDFEQKFVISNACKQIETLYDQGGGTFAFATT